MSQLSSYDSVPYVSQPFSFTHPKRLETLAMLFGLEPAPSSRCRVLELGCSAAGNLCGMAVDLPGSEFFGVDFSASEIRRGRQLVAELGLNNLLLEELDIKDFGGEFGTFDYIICHGVFSWVSPELQQHILRICRNQLRPEGLASISYNTLPGWYPRQMLRDMLLYHAEQFRDTDMFVKQARAMTTLLLKGLRGNEAPYAVFLKNSLNQIREQPDWYLRHDVLEEINRPMYFSQFAEMLRASGLQYVGDSELPKMTDYSFPEDVRQPLRAVAADIIRFEQYLDFLWNRGFRRSLVCHGERALSRESAWQRVERCHLSSGLRCVSDSEAEIQRFEEPSSGFLETNDPMAIHVLQQLAASAPHSLPFDELFRSATADLREQLRIPPQAQEEREHLAQSFWNLAMRGLVELQLSPWEFSSSPGERPEAFSLARAQAERDLEVTNARHEVVVLDRPSAALLLLLDGSRRREECLERLRTAAVGGEDQAVYTESWLNETLEEFARQALLQR
jgi:methyltransferase-like protein/2-polyprenyl-3-methyl-5-hydroxy-6-metoxy-1,4-benzoquinol methylase